MVNKGFRLSVAIESPEAKELISRSPGTINANKI